jgi:hypothetical protein
MKILYLHGWRSVTGGVKPTYLARAGHEVLNPALPDDDFDAAAAIAQAEIDHKRPDVIAGSSRGGAIAMNVDSGETPLVLLCPAWKKYGLATTVKPGTVVLHSRADDVVAFADSLELVLASALPRSALIEVGNDHRLADPQSLAKLLRWCERAPHRSTLARICLVAIDADGRPGIDVALDEDAKTVCEMSADHYRRTTFDPPWIGYFAVSRGQLVGSCGFKSPPCGGRVEIAYGTNPGHEGQGIATEMAGRLVSIAQAFSPGVLVTAQTLPQENASCSVLRKLGFTKVDTVMHPEDGPVWEWHLKGGHRNDRPRRDEPRASL